MIFNSFAPVLGKHRGERIAIVAPGPSLRELQSLTEFEVAIFVGDAHIRTKLRAPINYYVRANSEVPRLDSPSEMETLVKEGFALFIASSVMESDIPVRNLASQIDLDITLFDQRHFNGQACLTVRKCCDDKIEPTIQEYLAEIVGWEHHYSQGPSVILHALALALITDPAEVVVFGAGIPLKRSDYTYLPIKSEEKVNSKSILQRLNFVTLRNLVLNPRNLRFRLAEMILGDDAPSILAEDFFDLIADLQYISDAAMQLGIKLRNASSHSNLSRVHGIVGYRKP